MDNDSSENDEELEERLYFCTESGDAVLLKSLLDQECNPNYKFEGCNQLDKSLLHLSCEKGHEQCANILLQNGAKVNIVDGWYQTPLMYAVCTQRENMVSLLVEQGCDLNSQDKFGRTALHYAVRADSIAVLKVLVQAGCKLNLKDAVGQTPLYEAVTIDDRVSIVEYLIEKGSSVSEKDYREKRSPLGACILRAKKDRAAYVHLLLKSGADPNNLDRYAHTPFISIIARDFRKGDVIAEDDVTI